MVFAILYSTTTTIMSVALWISGGRDWALAPFMTLCSFVGWGLMVPAEYRRQKKLKAG